MAYTNVFGKGDMSSSPYTEPTYTAPSPALKESAKTSWLDLARLYLAYRGSRGSGETPNIKQIPLTPEQKQWNDLYYKLMTNPALANNAAEVNQMGNSVLKGYEGLKWESPKTFSGDFGYKGSSTGYSFPTSPNAPPPKRPEPGTQGGEFPDLPGGPGTRVEGLDDRIGDPSIPVIPGPTGSQFADERTGGTHAPTGATPPWYGPNGSMFNGAPERGAYQGGFDMVGGYFANNSPFNSQGSTLGDMTRDNPTSEVNLDQMSMVRMLGDQAEGLIKQLGLDGAASYLGSLFGIPIPATILAAGTAGLGMRLFRYIRSKSRGDQSGGGITDRSGGRQNAF